jgi:flagellar biosynthesis protein FliQ
MNQQIAVDLIRNALLMTFWVSLPVLSVLFVVGIVISLIQTLTAIQDPAVGAIPRLAVLLVVISLGLPWMLGRLINYAHELLTALGRYAH